MWLLNWKLQTNPTSYLICTVLYKSSVFSGFFFTLCFVPAKRIAFRRSGEISTRGSFTNGATLSSFYTCGSLVSTFWIRLSVVDREDQDPFSLWKCLNLSFITKLVRIVYLILSIQWIFAFRKSGPFCNLTIGPNKPTKSTTRKFDITLIKLQINKGVVCFRSIIPVGVRPGVGGSPNFLHISRFAKEGLYILYITS